MSYSKTDSFRQLLQQLSMLNGVLRHTQPIIEPPEFVATRAGLVARGLVAHSAFYSSLSTNGVQRFWLRDFGAPRSYVDVDDQGYSTALLFSSLGLRGKKTTLHCTLCISDARRVPHVAAVLMTASELAGAVTERPDLGLSHITIDVRQQNTSVNKPVYEVFIRTYQDLLTGASAWPHELLSAPCLD